MTSAVKETKSYRTIDLVTIATLGVAFGVIYWGWGKVYEAPSETLGLIYPPLKGLTASPWLIAGVLGVMILRKPGAALATEFVAAAVSTLVLGGTQWGWTVLASGLIQGLGAELAFLLFAYRRWTLGVACLAGALAAAFEAVYEWFSYYPDWAFDQQARVPRLLRALRHRGRRHRQLVVGTRPRPRGRARRFPGWSRRRRRG